MKINEMMFDRSIRPTDAIDKISRLKDGQIDFEDEKIKKLARNFESVFLNQILDKMKETIPESEDEDPAAGQIKDMFWSNLGQTISDNGGMGFWKEIYNDIKARQKAQQAMAAEVSGQSKIDINA